MVENNSNCADTLHQIAAIRTALDAVSVALLSEHVADAFTNSEKNTAQTRAELQVLLTRLRSKSRE